MASKHYKCVALDTNILSYLHASSLPESSESNSRRDKIAHFINTQKARDSMVIVPMFAIVEYLTGIDASEHAAEFKKIYDEFIVQDFDTSVSSHMTKLFKNKLALQEYAKEYKISREHVKIDMYIAANSLAGGAEAMLTNNARDFRKLTNGELAIIQLDDLPNPPSKQKKTK